MVLLSAGRESICIRRPAHQRSNLQDRFEDMQVATHRNLSFLLPLQSSVPWIYGRAYTGHRIYVFVCILGIAYLYSNSFESRQRPTLIHTKPGLSSTVLNFAG